jgi:hypothetical protein
MIRIIDPALVIDWLMINANKGKDRCPPAFNPELRISLNEIAFFGQGISQNF